MADLVIVGGGLAGCTLAREAALTGMSVTVLERGSPGAEASSAAAGMLSPVVGSHQPGLLSDLLVRAAGFHRQLTPRLEEESGMSVGYSAVGTLYLSLSEADDALLERRYGWQVGSPLGTERLDAHQAIEAEPSINPAVRWALRFPGDHQVENRLLTRAAWIAAARAGATFGTGIEVAALEREGSRVTGVRLHGGEVVRGDQVVIAGGCWSGLLGGLPRPLPVEPVRGQIVALESAPPLFRHVVDSPRCYTVPRADGRLLIGATSERAGFRKAVTAEGVSGLLEAAIEVAPSLRGAAIVESWSGLRPGTPDDLPILGPDPALEGLHYHTGHYRHGILLAPLTASLVLASLRSGDAEALRPFSAGRFAR